MDLDGVIPILGIGREKGDSRLIDVDGEIVRIPVNLNGSFEEFIDTLEMYLGFESPLNHVEGLRFNLCRQCKRSGSWSPRRGVLPLRELASLAGSHGKITIKCYHATPMDRSLTLPSRVYLKRLSQTILGKSPAQGYVSLEG